MNIFSSVKPEEYDFKPFWTLGKEWMLITAEKEGKANSMTAGWGGLGHMWNKDVALIAVRESRYTKEFIDGSEYFSLTFFDTAKYRKMLTYMGTVSGRDENKAERFGLTLAYRNGVPYYNEASQVIMCKKICRQSLDVENIMADGIQQQWYSDPGHHDLYIGEVLEILTK